MGAQNFQGVAWSYTIPEQSAHGASAESHVGCDSVKISGLRSVGVSFSSGPLRRYHAPGADLSIPARWIVEGQVFLITIAGVTNDI